MASRKSTEKADRSERSPEYREIRTLEDQEREHAQRNGPRPFYHPGRSANVQWIHDGTPQGRFDPVKVPAGKVADAETWEANGRTGAAPWTDAPEPEPESEPQPKKAAHSKPRPEKSEAFLMVRGIEARERAHIAAGNPPRVFYHPGRSANGHFNPAGQFEAQEIPAGYELDLDAWEQAGQEGEAPLRLVVADEVPEPLQVGTSESVEVDNG